MIVSVAVIIIPRPAVVGKNGGIRVRNGWSFHRAFHAQQFIGIDIGAVKMEAHIKSIHGRYRQQHHEPKPNRQDQVQHMGLNVPEQNQGSANQHRCICRKKGQIEQNTGLIGIQTCDRKVQETVLRYIIHLKSAGLQVLVAVQKHWICVGMVGNFNYEIFSALHIKRFRRLQRYCGGFPKLRLGPLSRQQLFSSFPIQEPDGNRSLVILSGRDIQMQMGPQAADSAPDHKFLLQYAAGGKGNGRIPQHIGGYRIQSMEGIVCTVPYNSGKYPAQNQQDQPDSQLYRGLFIQAQQFLHKFLFSISLRRRMPLFPAPGHFSRFRDRISI